MKQLITLDGNPIIGIFEMVPGRALINGFTEAEDGSLEPEYAGETEMWWDEQKPITSVDDMSRMPWSNIEGYGIAYQCRTAGPFIYLDEDGNEWRRAQLTVKEDA